MDAQSPYRLRPAPYAAHSEYSRGRQHAESPPRLRSEFQRDRDRIVHSTAFRRLRHKTQVFVSDEGDLFRTRLTHSLEVAQIARSAARALALDEDLTEAIALAHDLGHTPFGHAGQHALNECMQERGGFEHNLQSLRIVDFLEQHYAAFDGLNLTFETREGILKHCSTERARELGAVGERFLRGGQPGLEAQLTNLADELAYNSHDVDDGLRAGLLDIAELAETELFGSCHAAVHTLHPGLPRERLRHEIIRRMIDAQVTDLIETSREAILAAGVASLDDVRNQSNPLIGFSPEMGAMHRELKRFLRRQMYRHHRVHRMTVKAKRIVRDLFGAFSSDLDLLPEHFREHASRLSAIDEHGQARAIADYIAGMTDRHALREHIRIFDLHSLT
jgi:dGTPase